MAVRRILIASFFFLLSTALGSVAEHGLDLQETANRLAGSIYTGPAMTTLRELSDGFGGRLTGSPAYNHAAEWAAAKFRGYGIQNVRLEPFTIPNGWVRGTAHGELVAPLPRPLSLESLGWSPSTPPGGIKADAVIVDNVSPDNIRAQADKIKGKIVFLDVVKILPRAGSKRSPTCRLPIRFSKMPERSPSSSPAVTRTTSSAPPIPIGAPFYCPSPAPKSAWKTGN